MIFGGKVVPVPLNVIWPIGRPISELARVGGVELPESEVILMRRVLSGIRDCELRFEVAVEVVGEGTSCGMLNCMPVTFEVAGLEYMPEKSLLDLLCIPLRGGAGLSKSTPSRDGAAPRYQAVGDGGDIWCECSSGNIGFGFRMLPSDPLR